VLLAAFVGACATCRDASTPKEQGLGVTGVLATTPAIRSRAASGRESRPSFNEGPVLRRGGRAAARLEWPRDKMHIQVSTTARRDAELASTVVAELRAAGPPPVNVVP